MILLLFCAGAAVSQGKIENTYNYLKQGTLDKAKVEIDLATGQTDLQAKASTWYYRGVVYHSIYESTNETYQKLSTDPLTEAYNSYLKAIKLDEEKEYLNDITKRLEIASISFYNIGVDEFSKNNYERAFACFENSLNINQMPLFNVIDTIVYLNAAICADKSGKTEKAKEYYKKLIELKYGGPKVFLGMAELYSKEKKYTDFVEILKAGISKYPNDCKSLLIKLINYYMMNNQKDKALDYLNIAIEKDSGNETFYFVKGSIYDQMEDYDNALIFYTKALEINTQYFDALYNAGVIYFNKGIDYIKNAEENMNNNSAYEELKAKAEINFKKALPYLESAYSNKNDDFSTMKTLLVIYNRLQMEEKFKEMKSLLNTE